MWDKEQYLDPRWQKKRLEVLDRDEWCCQGCYDNESTLHVHHRYYIKKTAIWDYPLEAFLTLCEECHEYETTTRKASEESLLFALRKKFLSAEVDFIAIENTQHETFAYIRNCSFCVCLGNRNS